MAASKALEKSQYTPDFLSGYLWEPLKSYRLNEVS